MKKPGDELSNDAVLTMCALVGVKFWNNGRLWAVTCDDYDTCMHCQPSTYSYLGHRTKGAAARLYCENHKLFATSGVTP